MPGFPPCASAGTGPPAPAAPPPGTVCASPRPPSLRPTGLPQGRRRSPPRRRRQRRSTRARSCHRRPACFAVRVPSGTHRHLHTHLLRRTPAGSAQGSVARGRQGRCWRRSAAGRSVWWSRPSAGWSVTGCVCVPAGHPAPRTRSRPVAARRRPRRKRQRSSARPRWRRRWRRTGWR
ncbi:hypothetical protein D3C81_1561120 [compost metagenome]